MTLNSALSSAPFLTLHDPAPFTLNGDGYHGDYDGVSASVILEFGSRNVMFILFKDLHHFLYF